MKKHSITFLAFFMVQVVFAQTEWAPVGAKWWVQLESGWTSLKFIVNYECTGSFDTLGHTYKIVHKKSFDGTENDLLFFQEGDKVYSSNAALQAVTLLFDYSKLAGEQFIMFQGQDTLTFYVDSVYVKNFSGDDINVQYGRTTNSGVELAEAYCEVYEGIGTNTGLWPEVPTDIISEMWYELVCYQKPDGRLYNMNPWLNVDCQALATPVNQAEAENTTLHISPNPASNEVLVEFQLPTRKAGSILVLDMLGKTIQQYNLPPAATRLKIDTLTSGIYFIVLKSEEQVFAIKKLIRM